MMFGFGRTKQQLAVLQKRFSALTESHVEKCEKIVELKAEIKSITAESKGHAAANRLNRQLRFEAQTEAKLLAQKLAAAEAALQKIADMVTPGSAPIGKRMAKVAADHLAGAAGVQAEAA